MFLQRLRKSVKVQFLCLNVISTSEKLKFVSSQPRRWNVRGLQCEANWGFLALRGSEHKTPRRSCLFECHARAGWVRCTKEPRRFNARKIKDSLTLRRTEPSLEKRHSSHPLFAENGARGLPVWGKWLFVKPIIDWVNGEELLWWAECKECFP